MRNCHKYLEEAIAALETTNNNISAEKFNQLNITIADALRAKKPVLICGNGGSAADALHFAAELVGRYKKERSAYNVLALSANTATITAIGNDYDYSHIYARQVEGFGVAEGVFIGISTSGNSVNVLKAAEMAKRKDMTVVGMTGENGGELAQLCDFVLMAGSNNTPEIQQVHLCFYHFICEQVEALLCE